MKVSHVLYKVNDLEKTVQAFTDQGFTVEYGRPNKPYNALVYFPKGPYIELIADMNMPSYVKWMLRFFGFSAFVRGMEAQNVAQEGYLRLAFDAPESSFAELKQQLKMQHHRTLIAPVKRKDVRGNTLKCKCLFPESAELPFVKSPFQVNDSSLVSHHKNGALGIEKITYAVSGEIRDILEWMSDDDLLEIIDGDGTLEVTFQFEQKGDE